MPFSLVRFTCRRSVSRGAASLTVSRLLVVLFLRARLHACPDLWGRTPVRPFKPARLHFYMLARWLRFHHGHQGLRHRSKAHHLW